MKNENFKSEMENQLKKYGFTYEEKLEIWTSRMETIYLAFGYNGYKGKNNWTIYAGAYLEIVRRWEFEISTVEQALKIIGAWYDGDMSDLTPFMD